MITASTMTPYRKTMLKPAITFEKKLDDSPTAAEPTTAVLMYVDVKLIIEEKNP